MLPPRPRLSRYSLLSLSEKRTDLCLADLSPGQYFDPDLEESTGLDAAALAAMGSTGCLNPWPAAMFAASNVL